MSQENVEIVRRMFSEWGRGNFWTPEYFDREQALEAVGLSE